MRVSGVGCTLGAAACLLTSTSAFTQRLEVEPFRTRNLSPLISIYAIPTWRTRNESFEFALTSELANHYRLSQRGPDTLILDGETWRNNVSISKAIGESWSVRPT